jgi:hypothetical protein
MKVFLMFLGLLLTNNAWPQTIIQACKDASGAIYYENSRTLKKHCKKVGDESVSVIPSTPRKQKLPISVGMSQD